MNQAFFGLTVLSLFLWGQAVYTWKQCGGSEIEMRKGQKIVLGVVMVLWVVVVLVGVVGILCHLGSDMVYAMGLFALVLALLGNGQMRRICGKA